MRLKRVYVSRSAASAKRQHVLGDSMDKRRLRSYLAAGPDETDPEYMFVHDRLGICAGPRRFSRLAFVCLQFFNGEHNLPAVQEQARRETANALIPLSFLENLVGKLEQSLLL